MHDCDNQMWLWNKSEALILIKCVNEWTNARIVEFGSYRSYAWPLLPRKKFSLSCWLHALDSQSCTHWNDSQGFVPMSYKYTPKSRKPLPEQYSFLVSFQPGKGGPWCIILTTLPPSSTGCSLPISARNAVPRSQSSPHTHKSWRILHASAFFAWAWYNFEGVVSVCPLFRGQFQGIFAQGGKYQNSNDYDGVRSTPRLGGSGGMLPQENFESTTSETASGSFSDYIGPLPHKSCGHSHLLIKIYIWCVAWLAHALCPCKNPVFQWNNCCFQLAGSEYCAMLSGGGESHGSPPPL